MSTIADDFPAGGKTGEFFTHSPAPPTKDRREHVVILLDDDVRIEGDLLQAELHRLHEIAFQLAADNGMEFDAHGRPRATTRPNVAFGQPKQKKITLTLTLTLDPENAVIWKRGRTRSRAQPRSTLAPLHPLGESVMTPVDRALRGDLLLALLAVIPMPETIDAYHRMTGRWPPQRRLTTGVSSHATIAP